MSRQIFLTTVPLRATDNRETHPAQRISKSQRAHYQVIPDQRIPIWRHAFHRCKKEPGSPDIPAPRHRPRKLDLSKGGQSNHGGPRPLTARDNLGIQEVGIACLSPGFVTQDPVMKEQLQRSMSVREQQRHIIEARLQQQSAKGDGPIDKDNFAAKTPGMSRRNKAPPGLSIVAPSHEHFANERVIQSAPLNQTFTGMHNPHPLTRHITNQPSKLSNTSHIHHVPANQTNNRLPPIHDVFGQGLPHLPSPRLTTSTPPSTAREPLCLLPGTRLPAAPCAVLCPAPTDASRSSKRRTRAEYEEGHSPPLGNGPSTRRPGPFGYGRDSPETQRAKREEFLRLCERAWDLFHS
ncbi:unnamed protein product [Parascedosporium putredinis]|uniref:Uncharacterized protein n=1 Tax=Parascedosporium putredinis TaxID=1442378 RepID=A0A9P1HAU9_9PEZI|nr:unnamed protein product [Parascedosporium putredinis]CAI8003240.1 unnamed protein product [Parascedosporium putredinis]